MHQLANYLTKRGYFFIVKGMPGVKFQPQGQCQEETELPGRSGLLDNPLTPIEINTPFRI